MAEVARSSVNGSPVLQVSTGMELYLADDGGLFIDDPVDDADNVRISVDDLQWLLSGGDEPQRKAQEGWVRCEERTPELETYVLAHYVLGLSSGCIIARRVGVNGNWYSPCFPVRNEDVTHWRPLPPPPKAAQ